MKFETANELKEYALVVAKELSEANFDEQANILEDAVNVSTSSGLEWAGGISSVCSHILWVPLMPNSIRIKLWRLRSATKW